jgi:two-component system response regulator (stage 0 sporulation protein F)
LLRSAKVDEKLKDSTGSDGGGVAEPAKRTILLVDDEGASREKIGAILGRHGYVVIDRPDAVSALAVARDMTSPIDLVITDYRMPNMDGLEFAQELKRAMPGTPLILITGHSDIRSYLEALNIGVFEYLNKPIIANELLRIVSLALKQRKDGNNAEYLL